MCIRNRALALIFRLALIIGCLVGVYLNSGLAVGKFSLLMFVYYTIQTNVLVLVTFLYIAFCTARDLSAHGVNGTSMPLPHFKGAVTMAIAVTGLVFHFILAPQQFVMGSDTHMQGVSNFLVHYYVPIMTVLDWLLFDRKNTYRWLDPFFWLIIPFGYFVFAMVRAQFGGNLPNTGSPYPYFFIDPGHIGWGGVGVTVIVLAVAFLALGFLIVLVDKINVYMGRLRFGGR